MTKKDYVCISAEIRSVLECYGNDMDTGDITGREALEELTSRLCTVFQRDNPRFDRTRFLEACRPR